MSEFVKYFFAYFLVFNISTIIVGYFTIIEPSLTFLAKIGILLWWFGMATTLAYTNAKIEVKQRDRAEKK